MKSVGAENLLPAIDREKALEILDGDIELYSRLVESLAVRAQENYANILQAMDDLATLERLAHNLKGVSATMTAEPLREVSEKLESHARSGNTAAFRALLPLLRERISELVEFAKQEATPLPLDPGQPPQGT
jgi:HPt (histidine-containing phosphotransfer) domain-containing protein